MREVCLRACIYIHEKESDYMSTMTAPEVTAQVGDRVARLRRAQGMACVGGLFSATTDSWEGFWGLMPVVSASHQGVDSRWDWRVHGREPVLTLPSLP